MDLDIIKLWEENKSRLREYFSTTKQSEYDDYKIILRKIVELVLNNNNSGYLEYDAENISVIDNGDYQGTLVFLIPRDTYQPSEDDYLVTYVSYGSCSGCDILQSIHSYDCGLPDEDQIKDYMTLCLHLIQKMKSLY